MEQHIPLTIKRILQQQQQQQDRMKKYWHLCEYNFRMDCMEIETIVLARRWNDARFSGPSKYRKEFALRIIQAQTARLVHYDRRRVIYWCVASVEVGPAKRNVARIACSGHDGGDWMTHTHRLTFTQTASPHCGCCLQPLRNVCQANVANIIFHAFKIRVFCFFPSSIRRRRQTCLDSVPGNFFQHKNTTTIRIVWKWSNGVCLLAVTSLHRIHRLRLVIHRNYKDQMANVRHVYWLAVYFSGVSSRRGTARCDVVAKANSRKNIACNLLECVEISENISISSGAAKTTTSKMCPKIIHENQSMSLTPNSVFERETIPLDLTSLRKALAENRAEHHILNNAGVHSTPRDIRYPNAIKWLDAHHSHRDLRVLEKSAMCGMVAGGSI